MTKLEMLLKERAEIIAKIDALQKDRKADTPYTKEQREEVEKATQRLEDIALEIRTEKAKADITLTETTPVPTETDPQGRGANDPVETVQPVPQNIVRAVANTRENFSVAGTRENHDLNTVVRNALVNRDERGLKAGLEQLTRSITTGGGQDGDKAVGELLLGLVDPVYEENFVERKASVEYVTSNTRIPLIQKVGVAETAEGSEKAKSNANVVNDVPVALKINVGVFEITEEMIADSSFDLAGRLATGLMKELTEQGMLSAVAKLLATVKANAPRQVASANNNKIVYTDLNKVMYKVVGEYRNRGSWVMNSDALGQVAGLESNAGEPVHIIEQTADKRTTMLYREVDEASNMEETSAGKYPLFFIDLTSCIYAVGRERLQVMIDPYSKSTSGIYRVIGRQRTDFIVPRTDYFSALKIKA